ncbi:MAG: TraE/TraK family type IV conjugative transfer system protein [Bacteriovoracia bacterium]
MLTAMDKGIEAAQVATRPVGVYQGVDLRVLPKFVAFKAAMLKERLTLQYILAIHVAAFAANFAFSRIEIHGLEKKLREKEYILAPGVMDFTTAAPQTVSDSYVVNAGMSFLSMLGNVNAANIDEQYKRLATFMAPELRVQFEAEVAEWRETVKNENISEILRITDREAVATGEGFYKMTAIANRERYSNSESLGRVDEVIELTMRLVPPMKGKEWYLEITSLKRSRADGFKAAQPINQPKTGK